MLGAAALVGVVTAPASAAQETASTPCPTSAPSPDVTVPGDTVGFAQAYTAMLDPIRRVRRDFAAIAATGAEWVHFDLLWSDVQRAGRDEWDWRKADRAIDAAHDAGLRVLATLAYTPKWARPKGAGEKAFAPRDPADFARFAGAAARRYGPQGVHAYEVWNEPNLSYFWRPSRDPEAYTELLRLAYDAIHEEDPDAVVIGGALAAFGHTPVEGNDDGQGALGFLRDMYGAGAQGSFDALSFHPYTNPGPPTVTEPYAGFCQTALLHDELEDRGDATTPIWATEAGAYTGDDAADPSAFYFPLDEETQAEHVRQYVTLWQAWPFPTGPIFLYTLRDPPETRAYGLLGANRREKAAYEVVAATVDGGRACRC